MSSNSKSEADVRLKVSNMVLCQGKVKKSKEESCQNLARDNGSVLVV